MYTTTTTDAVKRLFDESQPPRPTMTAALRAILDQVQAAKEWVEQRWTDYPSRAVPVIEVGLTLEEVSVELERLLRVVMPEFERLVADEDARSAALAAQVHGVTVSNR